MPNLGPDHIFNLNLNSLKLQSVIKEMEKYMLQTLTREDREISLKNKTSDQLNSPVTTSIHDKFNILTYPDKIIFKLYSSIREAFYSIKPDGDFSIKMWLNVYKPGEFLNYHDHMKQKIDAFYGHVSVKGGGVTSYKNTETNEIVNHVNSDNTFVMSRPQDTVLHRTWPQDEERITFGFDIANVRQISKITAPFGFWIPL